MDKFFKKMFAASATVAALESQSLEANAQTNIRWETCNVVQMSDQNKTQTKLFSANHNSDIFQGDINYQQLGTEMHKKGEELAIGFAGAYKAPDGSIEGVTYQDD